MSNFDIYKWNRKRYITEAGLNEGIQADNVYDAYFQAVVKQIEDSKFDNPELIQFLKRYKNYIEMDVKSWEMSQSLNEAEEMATYKVTVTLAEPGEGGPDYDEDVEVKVDASLSGDELRAAVRDAIGKEGYNRKNIYKFKYEKA